MSEFESYDAVSQVLMFALDCLQARGRCDGVTAYVSPGIAAYECDQLTGRVFDIRIDRKDQCNTYYSIGVEIQLVRCCVPVGSANASPNPLEIDAAAKCIYADLQSLFECLVCEDAAISQGIGTIDCQGLELQGVDYDTAPSGTCFGGRLKLYTRKIVCCT